MFLLLLTLSCQDGSDSLVEDAVYSGDWVAPSPADLEDLDLPLNEEGDYILYEDGGVGLYADPTERSPMSAAAGCAALIVACHEPELRNLRGCFEHVPTCSTDEPWQEDAYCCDPGCADGYVTLREEGLEPARAATDTLLGENSCMPGLDAWLEGSL